LTLCKNIGTKPKILCIFKISQNKIVMENPNNFIANALKENHTLEIFRCWSNFLGKEECLKIISDVNQQMKIIDIRGIFSFFYFLYLFCFYILSFLC
jgi:hypothetical protein